MRYKPERALTQTDSVGMLSFCQATVEMRYKPERALTPKMTIGTSFANPIPCRNEV